MEFRVEQKTEATGPHGHKQSPRAAAHIANTSAGLMQVQFVAGMRREAVPLSGWFAAAATHAMLFEEKYHEEFS